MTTFDAFISDVRERFSPGNGEYVAVCITENQVRMVLCVEDDGANGTVRAAEILGEALQHIMFLESNVEEDLGYA